MLKSWAFLNYSNTEPTGKLSTTMFTSGYFNIDVDN